VESEEPAALAALAESVEREELVVWVALAGLAAQGELEA
jgi:hypothetical protein